MKVTREVKTALLVIFGIALFIYLYNYLKGENLFESNITYYTRFDYNALDTSSPVTIKGNTVGKITHISYDFNSGKTLVELSVSKDLRFSKNSYIRMYEMGLMGGNALAIIPAEDDADKAKAGDYLESEVEPGLIRNLSKNFSGISTNLDSTLKSADTLFVSLNQMVTDDSDKGLKATLAELKATLAGFKTLSYSINNTLTKNDENIAAILENFKVVSQNLTQLSSELKDANLGDAVSHLDSTLVSVNTLMSGLKKGGGTMGKLLTDDELYKNLSAASKQLEELLKDVKLHPKRYTRILSKKEIPYQPEESNQ